jgi:hypothetical protein
MPLTDTRTCRIPKTTAPPNPRLRRVRTDASVVAINPAGEIHAAMLTPARPTTIRFAWWPHSHPAGYWAPADEARRLFIGQAIDGSFDAACRHDPRPGIRRH